MMEATETNGAFEYDLEFDYPYGDFTIDYMHAQKGKDPEEEPDVLKPLLDVDKEYVTFLKQTLEPVPKSMEKLGQEHAQEEEENKRREQEARMAQKRLEEEKARLRYEQQQQIAKQEQNTA
jgi:hypothetical protein